MTKANQRYEVLPSQNGNKFNKNAISDPQEIKILKLEELLSQQSKELKELHDSNTQFISIIAHDLRSPFGSIIGALEILKKSLLEGNTEEFEMLINIASKSTQRTLNLLDNLLSWTFSQDNGNYFVVEKSNFDLDILIKDELQIYEDIAYHKQIHLSHSLTNGFNINADPRMMATVIRNLIDNAIKYTNTGGKIFIYTKQDGEFINIVIKDNGAGMSKNQVEGFLNLDSVKSTDSGRKTTGLGLFLCKELVRLHNGTISLISIIGKGTEFKVTLPR